MRISIFHSAMVSTLLAGALLAGGCRRPDASPGPAKEEAAAASASPPSVAAPSSLSVTEVRFVGDDPDSSRPLVQRPDRPIRVRLQSSGGGNGETLHAKLIDIADGTLAGQRTHIFSKANEAIVLEFQPASGKWVSSGRYLLELTLDGKLLSHHDLDIAPESALMQ